MGKVRTFFRSAGKFLFPKCCLLCQKPLGFYAEGEFCPECLEKYRGELEKPCGACRESCGECRCDAKRTERVFGSPHRSVLGFYRDHEDAVGRLVYRLKRQYDRDLQKFFARSLGDKLLSDLGKACGDFSVTYPPREKKSAHKYGFDQSERLSAYIAERIGCPRERIFIRKGGEIQKKLDYEGRMKNAEEMFVLDRQAEIKGKCFIVVDDVTTSGATLGALAGLLYSAGAEWVYPAALFASEPKERKPKDEGLWFEEE